MTKRAERGFTLIEVLVMLIVAGMLIAGLTQGSRVAMRLEDSQGKALRAADTLDSVDRTVRTLIAQMEPGEAAGLYEIEGKPASLRFITRLPEADRLARTRRAEVELFVDAADRLILSTTPRPHVAEATAEPARETVLARRVRRIALSYFPEASGDGEAGEGWRSEWSSRVPPMLVRLHVDFTPGDGRDWPDIVATTMRARMGD